MALDHSQSNVRILALKRLKELYVDLEQGFKTIIRKRFVDKLDDHCEKVVSLILEFPELLDNDRVELIEALLKVLVRVRYNVKCKCLDLVLSLLDGDTDYNDIIFGECIVIENESYDSELILKILNRIGINNNSTQSSQIAKLIQDLKTSHKSKIKIPEINQMILKVICDNCITSEMKLVFSIGLNSKSVQMVNLSLLVISNLVHNDDKFIKILFDKIKNYSMTGVYHDLESSFVGNPPLPLVKKLQIKSDTIEPFVIQYAILSIIESLVRNRPIKCCWFVPTYYENYIIDIYHFACDLTNIKLRDLILRKLIDLHFKDQDLEFYASICSSLKKNSIFISLTLLSKFISLRITNAIPYDFQLLLPSLLLTLTDKNNRIRQSSIECLNSISNSYAKLFEFKTSSTTKASHIYGYSTFYGDLSSNTQYLTCESSNELVSLLILRRNEILSDYSFLANNIHLLLSAKNRYYYFFNNAGLGKIILISCYQTLFRFLILRRDVDWFQFWQ
jgi:hypothetical protein